MIEFGRVISLSFGQSARATVPMYVTLFGIVIDYKLIHSWNAPPSSLYIEHVLSSIVVTLSGMITLVKSDLFS